MCEGKGCHDHRSFGRCCASAGRVHGFVQPWLLLLLLEKPSHGYELMERLAQDEDIPWADPGLLYRTLRQLEDEGLVHSSWDTDGRGPARRLYEVTPEGLDFLHAWAARILRTRRRLDRFLAEYETRFPSEEKE